VYLIFYAEYAVSLGLDLYKGPPNYSGEPGFAVSSEDPYVSLLYCIFVFLVPLIWLWKAKPHPRVAPTPSPQWVSTLLRLGSFLPLIVILAAPEPGVYLEYAGVIRSDASLPIRVFHIFVSMATMVAVLCAAVRCLVESLNKRCITEVAAAIALSIWANGKRYIVAEALMFVVLALWYRGAVAGRKLLWTMMTGVLLLGAFSVTYQFIVRDISFGGSASDTAAEDARVDYTRDSRVKMALYAELYPEKMRILDYRGQNLLYYATLPVPRSIWSNKPYPYATYFTSAMLNRYPQDLGWGMTTGIFDESISNFGLLGVLIGPLVVRWFCAVGDSVHEWSIHILTCIIGSLLMSVQLAASIPLVLLWLVVVVKSKHVPFWRPSATCSRGSGVSA
jgi:hypothetical protein